MTYTDAHKEWIASIDKLLEHITSLANDPSKWPMLDTERIEALKTAYYLARNVRRAEALLSELSAPYNYSPDQRLP